MDATMAGACGYRIRTFVRKKDPVLIFLILTPCKPSSSLTV
jgi:hypothetical protein